MKDYLLLLFILVCIGSEVIGSAIRAKRRHNEKKQKQEEKGD